MSMVRLAGRTTNIVLSIIAALGLLFGFGGWASSENAETVLQQQAGFSLMIVGAIALVGGLLGNLIYEIGHALLAAVQLRPGSG
jgi:hypothetical protein